MSIIKANPGKKPEIKVGNKTYIRLPIKTHLISDKDNIIEVADKYTKDTKKSGDILVISERVVAVSQGRSFLITDIHPSWWANFLSKYVTKHPGGIGLRSPWTMELAIQEAGLPRILLASFVAMITKTFGFKGIFYHVVGNDINAIDGPCEYTLPPGNKSAKLGPKNPMRVAQQIADQIKIDVAIIDSNDYGTRVMGTSNGVDKKFIENVFKDNPFGQENQQTPMALVRLA